MKQVVEIENSTDGKYFVTLDVDFWQEQPVAFVYFIYMNPMFVLSAWFGGYQCLLMSFLSVYVLSLVRETEHARKSGQSLM